MKKEDFDAIKVGTELRSMSGACTERHRVIELGAHGQHTTLSLGTPGLEPYKWYGSLASYAFAIESQPPVEVGDEFTNGTQVWKVTAYDAKTDTITIVGEAGGVATYTRKTWPAWALSKVEKPKLRAISSFPFLFKPDFMPWHTVVIGTFAPLPSKAPERKPGQRWLGRRTGTIYTVESVATDGRVKFVGFSQGNDLPIEFDLSNKDRDYDFLDNDEVKAVPPPSYIPAKNDRVRITEVYEGDAGHSSKLKGRVVLTLFAEPSTAVPGLVYLEYAEEYGADAGKWVSGAWLRCKLEKVTAPARKVGQTWRGNFTGKEGKIIDIDAKGCVRFDGELGRRNAMRSANGPNTFDSADPAIGYGYTFVSDAPAAVVAPKLKLNQKWKRTHYGNTTTHTVAEVRADGWARLSPDPGWGVYGFYWPEQFGEGCTFTEVIEVKPEMKPEPAKPAAKSGRKPGFTMRAIEDAWVELGPNARELLADIAERLVKGKEHGDFEKALDWNREAYEEDLDGIVYRTMKLRSAA